MKTTLGGDRLGSGGKMKVDMHGFSRSSHNQSEIFRSTLSCGTLVPCYCNIGLNGTTFDIDVNAKTLTLPTNAPLFGTFKKQIDFFRIPIRLYSAPLHNNALNIGREMQNIKLPQIKICGNVTDAYIENQFDQSCLLAYLGKRGLGYGEITEEYTTNGNDLIQSSTTSAIFTLAYYDIYKNYYANKQEDKAYIITANVESTEEFVLSLYCLKNDQYGGYLYSYTTGNYGYLEDTTEADEYSFTITYKTDLTSDSKYSDIKSLLQRTIITRQYYNNVLTEISAYDWLGDYSSITDTAITVNGVMGERGLAIKWSNVPIATSNKLSIVNIETVIAPSTAADLNITGFDLTNIDDMRTKILAQPITSPLIIDENADLPYSALCGYVSNDDTTIISSSKHSKNYYSQNGLALKTYQSDIYNNWLSTEWIDGTDGINAITAVDTSSGSFTIDTLNLANKVYNMLNRIAVSGGSYYDWQEAVYDEKAIRRDETPIYVGGVSCEIVFDEVVSTAETNIGENTQALGSLAGKGGNTRIKGGKIRIKCDEPCMIMGIVSITPRIDYSQGNAWWTNIETMDDWHKPPLDGIGFQELITEQIAYWDTTIEDGQKIYKSAGKQPAWINYMTSFNKCYGHFADPDELMIMTLNRRYNRAEDGSIEDLTTYIDPTKYNYAFAYSAIDAQNFWEQISFDVIARRKMSAKIMPNL